MEQTDTEGMYEENLNLIKYEGTADKRCYIVKEVCEKLGYDYDKFMKELTKVSGEIL